MSGNLPPGTTPADIDHHYGGGVPDHEHEWMPVEGLHPVLEDMAAIFHEQCRWAEVVDSYTDHRRDETYYETGAECSADDFEGASNRLLWFKSGIHVYDVVELAEDHAIQAVTQ